MGTLGSAASHENTAMSPCFKLSLNSSHLSRLPSSTVLQPSDGDVYVTEKGQDVETGLKPPLSVSMNIHIHDFITVLKHITSTSRKGRILGIVSELRAVIPSVSCFAL